MHLKKIVAREKIGVFVLTAEAKQSLLKKIIEVRFWFIIIISECWSCFFSLLTVLASSQSVESSQSVSSQSVGRVARVIWWSCFSYFKVVTAMMKFFILIFLSTGVFFFSQNVLFFVEADGNLEARNGNQPRVTNPHRENMKNKVSLCLAFARMATELDLDHVLIGG